MDIRCLSASSVFFSPRSQVSNKSLYQDWEKMAGAGGENCFSLSESSPSTCKPFCKRASLTSESGPTFAEHRDACV